MALIKCKMCGGDLKITEGLTVAECEYCGSRQTIPSADNEKKMTLFTRAARLLRGCEFDKAAGLFESIVADFPEEAEAYWGLVLCKYGIEYVDDPATGKKVPTCHRSSFDSVLDDANFEQACENTDAVARRVYRDEARQIEELRKRIIEVSGREEPYDVFISYKETDENGQRTLDSVIAQDIYDELSGKGYRVFFSRISLEDKLGVEYEPYIFAALNSAKLMLVVGTDYEHFDAVWVKNEWSRFLKLIASGEKKVLIPVFKNMDAYDMPKEFAKLSAQDMGKLGAMQDLLRGVEKILGRRKEPTKEERHETVIVQQSGVNTAALLKRGAMALEDGDWEKADGFFEEVLNHDAECVGAYIGKTLYETKSHSLDEFIKKLLEKRRQDSFKPLYIEKDAEHINSSVKKYTLPGYLKTEEILPLYDYKLQYSSRVDSRLLQKEQTLKDWDSYKWLARAQRFDPEGKDPSLTRAKRELNNQLERRIKEAQREEEEEKRKLEAAYAAHLAKADEKARAAYDNAAKRREADYQSYLKSAKYENNISKLHETAKLFETLNGYKDSVAQAEGCRSKAAEIKRRQELEAARLKAERAEKTKKAAIIIGTVAALAAAVILVITTVIPAMKYSSAQEALDAGNYDEAIAAFAALDDYKDSAAQAEHAQNLKTAELERIAAEKAAEAARLEAERQAAIEAEEKARQEAEAARLEAEAAAEAARLEAEAAAEAARLEAEAEAERVRIAAEEAAEKARLEAEEAARLLYESSLEGRYEAAMELMEKEKIAEAAIAFGQIADYKDARELSFALWDELRTGETISAGKFFAVGLGRDSKVLATEIHFVDEHMSSIFGNSQLASWKDIVEVSTGFRYTLGRTANGTVMCGEFDEKYDRYTQGHVDGWSDVVAISSGYNHAVGLRSDGTVLTIGDNYIGQNKVDAWSDIISVSAGGMHTVGVRSDGTVLAVGSNTYNQGDVGTWTDIVAISAGHNHTVGLKSDGTVVATGHNGNGQCDVGEWTDIIAVSASIDHTVGLKADGTVVATGDNYYGQCNVGDWESIVAVSVGETYTVALRKDGVVLVAGGDEAINVATQWTNIALPGELEHNKLYAKAEAQLARGNKGAAAITFYKAGKYEDARERSMALWDEVAVRDTIAAGEDIVALRNSGSVLAADVLGRGNRISWSSMIAVDTGGYLSIGLKSDGTVICRSYHAGNKRFSDETLKDWKDIVSVSIGRATTAYRTLGLRADGTVLTYSPDSAYDGGYNVVSTWTDIVSVSAGGSALGLKSDGTVVAIGTDLSDWENVKAISAGGYHNVGLLEDGTVIATGKNNYGQCDVSDWTDIVAISAGTYHTVGIKSDGTVVAVGDNEFNKCDVSGWKDIVAISAGHSDTVGLRADGTVVTVGMSKDKGIDFSKWTDIKLPVNKISIFDKGFAANIAMTLFKSGDVKGSMKLWDKIAVRDSISSGDSDIIALMSDGTVLFSADNSAAASNASKDTEVGQWKDIVAVSAGNHHALGLKSDGTVISTKADRYKSFDFGQRDVGAWRNIVSISAGAYHSVGLKADGTVLALGQNTDGRCGVSDWADVISISAGDYHTVGLKSDGTVLAAGSNREGQCDVSGWTDIVALSAGKNYTVGLRADGTVLAAGNNNDGRCDVSGWTDVVSISTGIYHTVGLKSDGTVLATGSNRYGQCNVSDWTDVVAISVGSTHTAGLRSDGSVIAIGKSFNKDSSVNRWTDIRVPEI